MGSAEYARNLKDLPAQQLRAIETSRATAVAAATAAVAAGQQQEAGEEKKEGEDAAQIQAALQAQAYVDAPLPDTQDIGYILTRGANTHIKYGTLFGERVSEYSDVVVVWWL